VTQANTATARTGSVVDAARSCVRGAMFGSARAGVPSIRIRSRSIAVCCTPFRIADRHPLALALALVLFPGLPAESRVKAPAPAGSVPVLNCNDHGSGSLRDRVANAASGDTLDLTALSCGTIGLTTGEIVVAIDSLRLVGPGAEALMVDGAFASRLFRHDGTGTLAFSGMTLARGRVAGDSGNVYGGCILSIGSVSLTNATVDRCTAQTTPGGLGAFGGGVYTVGDLTLIRSRITGSIAHGDLGALGGGAYAAGRVNLKYSTIEENTAVADNSVFDDPYGGGGGLFAQNGGTLEGMTISGNHAQYSAGASFAGSEPFDIVNSTISGNDASVHVGGISLVTGTISNSTIAFNHEGDKYGSGVRVGYGGSLSLYSTIIADNTAGSGETGLDLAAGSSAQIDGSANLIVYSQSSPPGTLSTDPMLAPLADNGGDTWTHALLDGSPAIDAGSNDADLETDQRGSGFPRVVGSAADIGSYERSDRIFADGFD
jgi:hypothetical protein